MDYNSRRLNLHGWLFHRRDPTSHGLCTARKLAHGRNAGFIDYSASNLFVFVESERYRAHDILLSIKSIISSINRITQSILDLAIKPFQCV